MSGRAQLLGAVLAPALLVPALSARAGQPPAEASLADDGPGCIVEAGPALCDGTWFGDADATIDGITASRDGVDLSLQADFSSTFFVDVAQGAATGEWALGGNWTMDFSGVVSAEATVRSRADGTIGGSANAFGVSGTMSNEGTVAFGGDARTISNSHPLDGLQVRVTSGTCTEAVGEWSFSWASLAAEVGWSGTDRISGAFTAVRQPGFEQSTFDEIGSALADGTLTQQQIDAAPLTPAARMVMSARLEWRRFVAERPVPTDTTVERALDIAERLETALHDLRNEAGCEIGLDAESLSVHTSAPADIVQAIGERAAGRPGETVELGVTTLRRLFNAGTRTGLIGPGSSKSAETQAAFRAVLAAQVNRLVNTAREIRGDTVVARDGVTDAAKNEATLAAELALDAGLPVTVGTTKLELDDVLGAAIREAADRARRSDAAPTAPEVSIEPAGTDEGGDS